MKVAIYARVSTEKQGERDKSIPEQIAECEALCERRGFEIVPGYIDNTRYKDSKGKLRDPSGTRKDRPAYVQMLKDAQEGKFDVIVAWNEKRLYRSPRAVYPLKEVLDERDKQGKPLAIELVKGSIDRRTMNLLASIYEMEVEDMQDRMMRGKRGNARAGILEGGGLPYGYCYEDGKLIIYELEAAIVREIYRRYVSKISVPKILRWLNGEAIPTKKPSKGWQQSTVYEILRHPRYKGTRYFDGIPIPCPAIVDEELWERVQRVKEQNKNHNKRNTKEIYPLQSLLYCDECGRRMAVHRKDNKHSPPTRSYRCKSHIRYAGLRDSCKALNYVSADKMEAQIWRELEGFLRSPALLWEFTEESQRKIESEGDGIEERIKSLAKKLDVLHGERQNLIKSHRKKLINDNDLAYQLLDIEAQEEAYQEEYAHTVQTRDLSEASIDKLERAILICQRWTQVIAAAGPDPLPALNQELSNYAEGVGVGEILLNVTDFVGFITPENWPRKKLELQQLIFRVFLKRVWLNAEGKIRIEGIIPLEEADKAVEELSERAIPEWPIYRWFADQPVDRIKDGLTPELYPPFKEEAPWYLELKNYQFVPFYLEAALPV